MDRKSEHGRDGSQDPKKEGAGHLYAYDFRILAEDDAGHVTSSEIRTVTPYDSGLRGTITNLQAL